MIPLDQLSDAELLEILQRLDRRGMRVPLATATREVERYRHTARAIPPNVSGTARLLDLGAGRCDNVRSLAEGKRSVIAAQIRDLQSIHDVLDQLILACNDGNGTRDCAMIDRLFADNAAG